MGAFVDGWPEEEKRESRDIVECQGTTLPIFMFRTIGDPSEEYWFEQSNRDERGNAEIHQMIRNMPEILTEEAGKAWAWALEFSNGKLEFLLYDLPDYKKIKFHDTRDAVLFKLFWI